MIKEYFKWFFNKDFIVLATLFLLFIVPFSLFLYFDNSILATIWFILSEIFCTSFGVWYFSVYKKQLK